MVGTHRIDSRELFVMSREIYTRNASVRYHRFDAAREGIRMSEGPNSGPSARLDVWLDVTCLFRTRSEAQKAIGNGKITVNGQPAKAHRMLREGDQVVIGRPFGRRQTILVKGIAEKHVSKADARLLYEDLTPPPTDGFNSQFQQNHERQHTLTMRDAVYFGLSEGRLFVILESFEQQN